MKTALCRLFIHCSIFIFLIAYSCKERSEVQEPVQQVVHLVDTTELRASRDKVVDFLLPERTWLGPVSYLDTTFIINII